MKGSGKKTAIIPFLAIAYYFAMSGIDYLNIDYQTSKISSMSFISIRFVIAGIAFLIIHIIKIGKLNIAKKDWPRIIIAGIVGPVLYYSFEAAGIARLSGAFASLILAVLPIFGICADRIFFKIKLSGIQYIGVAASIIGVALIVLSDGGISGSLTGVICMFVAVILWTSYTIILKPLDGKYPTLTITTGTFLIGACCQVGKFFLYKPSEIMLISGQQWLLLILSTIGVIVLGQWLYVYGIGKVPVTVSTVLANLLPLVTVTISVVVMGMNLSIQQLIGGIVVLIAVVLASGLLKKKE